MEADCWAFGARSQAVEHGKKKQRLELRRKEKCKDESEFTLRHLLEASVVNAIVSAAAILFDSSAVAVAVR